MRAAGLGGGCGSGPPLAVASGKGHHSWIVLHKALNAPQTKSASNRITSIIIRVASHIDAGSSRSLKQCRRESVFAGVRVFRHCMSHRTLAALKQTASQVSFTSYSSKSCVRYSAHLHSGARLLPAAAVRLPSSQGGSSAAAAARSWSGPRQISLSPPTRGPSVTTSAPPTASLTPSSSQAGSLTHSPRATPRRLVDAPRVGGLCPRVAWSNTIGLSSVVGGSAPPPTCPSHRATTHLASENRVHNR